MIRQAWAIAQTVWLEMLRRKNFYVLLILLVAMLAYLMSLDVFGMSASVGYIKDLGLMLVWLFTWILTIPMTARLLPQEEATGTIYPLLAKPIARATLLLGKWLGAWLAVSLAMACFYLAVIAVVLVWGGRVGPATLVQALLLHAVMLGIFTALTLMLSTRMAADATATLAFILTLAAFVLAPNVPELLVTTQGLSHGILLALYYLLPHLDLFDLRLRLVHDWGAAPWLVVLATLVYGLLWSAVFLLLAWLGYRGKKFKRGQA